MLQASGHGGAGFARRQIMDRTFQPRARDLMQRDIITIDPETPILDVHRLFVEEEIHGAPVVDETGRVRGVISTLDLLRIVRDELEPGAGAVSTTYFRDDLPYSGPDWTTGPEDLQERVQHVTASDAMTVQLVTVKPSASVEDIATTMLSHHVHRVLVIGDEGALEGVITTYDLLRVLSPATRERIDAPAMHATGYRR
jgi:CBS domain-containing protein